MNTDTDAKKQAVVEEKPVIAIQGLHRSFGLKQEAVRGIDLNVSSGTVFALLGRNGAGKSTTLRMTANLLMPSSGSVRVFGKRASQLTSEDRTRIGYVSESMQLPGWMTVQQMADYFKPMYPTWDDAFAAELLRIFDLPPDRKLRNLSRGQFMKAAFLSNLAYHPQLLILDEPFSGLDLAVREELIEAILELTAQERWTILISSHDIDEVERLADEVGFLEDGKLALTSSLDALQERCRRIECTAAGDIAAVPSEKVPSSWVRVKQSARSLTFLHIAFQSVAQCQQELAEIAPSTAFEVQASSLGLKEIYLEFLRSAKGQDSDKLRTIWNRE